MLKPVTMLSPRKSNSASPMRARTDDELNECRNIGSETSGQTHSLIEKEDSETVISNHRKANARSCYKYSTRLAWFIS